MRPTVCLLAPLLAVACSGTGANTAPAGSAAQGPVPPAPAATTPAERTTRLPTGRINGRIQYPDSPAPAMRVCALRGDDAPVCINTPAGATQYRIEHLRAGDYVVIARPASGPLRIGGAVKPVQCIRAPCPAQLEAVLVAENADTDGVDLNGFYVERPEFPALP